jgi:hypothetical protein
MYVDLVDKVELKQRHMNFNDFIWHDAVIENISIDRNNPGINDSIKFDICWPSNDKSILIFEDVYWANFNLNFGVIGDESILPRRPGLPSARSPSQVSRRGWRLRPGRL